MLITEKRKINKMDKLNVMYKHIRESGEQIRVNDYWNDKTKATLKKSWKTKAYFIQDFKRFLPEDLTVTMAQKKGTFAFRIENTATNA